MTAGERAVWIAVYAASWHASGAHPIGQVTDTDRAARCAQQAGRAVDALRTVAGRADLPLSSIEAAEVLR